MPAASLDVMGKHSVSADTRISSLLHMSENGEGKKSSTLTESSGNETSMNDFDVESEESPLVSHPSSTRRHQFDAHETQSYFPEDSAFKELFSRQNSSLRFNLFLAWSVIKFSFNAHAFLSKFLSYIFFLKLLCYAYLLFLLLFMLLYLYLHLYRHSFYFP